MSDSNISAKRQIRVHYLHGLESGTTGRKVQLLRAAGYKVTAPAMLCSPNSILYHDPIIFYPLLLISASVLVITVFFGWYKGVALMLVLSIVLLNYSRVISTKLAERSFQRCVQQQLDVISADALNHTPADIYVASSFGGAVLLELVNRRCWGDARPPLLFLASAHKRTAESMGLVISPTFPSPLGHPCTIVHGSQDTVVPLEDSKALAHSGGDDIPLVVVNDFHMLSGITTRHFQTWINSLVQASRGKTETAEADSDADRDKSTSEEEEEQEEQENLHED